MAGKSLKTLHDTSGHGSFSSPSNRGLLCDEISNHSQRHKTISSLIPKSSQHDLRKSHWELTEKLRDQYKNDIFPGIDPELQSFFDSDKKGELITVTAYVIGKSQENGKPTILLAGGDCKTREDAEKIIKKSKVLKKYREWQVKHTSKFPGTSEMCNEPSVLDALEYWSSNGAIKWLDEGNDPSLATDVYFNLQLYSEQSRPLPSKGLAIYIKRPSCLRPASANIVRLGDRVFLQTVYHAFYPEDCTKESTGPGIIPRDLPALPSVESLVVVGRLLVWSIDRDWALIEVLSDEMNSRIKHTLVEDKEPNWIFQKAGRPSSNGTNACVWTATNGMLKVTLSETTTYMKLPNSSSFQEIHKARVINGSWSNGDSGAVVIDLAAKLTFGHILGGSRAAGVALIIAADQVVKDLQELNFSPHLRDNVSVAQPDHIHESITGSMIIETSDVTEPNPSITKLPSEKSPVVGDSSHNIAALLRSSSPGTKAAKSERRTSTSPFEESRRPNKRLLLGQDSTEPLGAGKHSRAMSRYRHKKKLLPETSPNVNAQGGIYGNALQAASSTSNEAVALPLFNNSFDLNAQGGDYGNALQAASSDGNEAVVRLLVDKGADVNVQGGYYGNALQAASCNGNEAVVRLLLEKGANVNAQGGRYSNALQAASYNGHEAVVRLLLEKGADVNAQGGYYGNALQAASCNGNEAVVRLLLEKGADVNAQGGRYSNALQAASCNGNETVVRLLLKKGAEINAQGGRYGNALQAASANGNEAVVRLLLDKGADVNAQGGYYGSALQAASAGGHKQTVKLLLDKGTAM
jgi:ankyrin repeat protein